MRAAAAPPGRGQDPPRVVLHARVQRGTGMCARGWLSTSLRVSFYLATGVAVPNSDRACRLGNIINTLPGHSPKHPAWTLRYVIILVTGDTSYKGGCSRGATYVLFEVLDDECSGLGETRDRDGFGLRMWLFSGLGGAVVAP